MFSSAAHMVKMCIFYITFDLKSHERRKHLSFSNMYIIDNI